MKNYTAFFLIALLSGLFSQTVFSQPVLPAGEVLSFNGVFTNQVKAGPGEKASDNQLFRAGFSILAVTDENRELGDFKLYKDRQLVYSKAVLPGAEFLLSNSGRLAVFDMAQQHNQQVTVHHYDAAGNLQQSHTYRYASLFGFSPSGDKMVVGKDKETVLYDLVHQTKKKLSPASEFSFSDDDRYLALAREDKLRVYDEGNLVFEKNTGLFYPRAVAVDQNSNLVAVVGKSTLLAYALEQPTELFIAALPDHLKYRDVRIEEGIILAGVHQREKGISRGILQVYNRQGTLTEESVRAEKAFKTFEPCTLPLKSTNTYAPIPWPFEPFDEVHKVWNHYEQHMGDGSGDWSYLHQGLDLEVPINEPTYAVAEGWVKLVLTLGGDAYWRVAVSPEQVPGYSDGWLYAHLVESSIQVDVGDYVDIHDYLGDIIYWSADWGHIHFVNIHDQGTIWYYNDDEWGINFNPLLALVPNTDETGPVIEDFSTTSKFGFPTNETSQYQNPNELSGAVDIIAKISDYHGTSEWEQPAYRTYYWIDKYPEGTPVVPKTLGQILNHTYTMYNGGYYEAYAPLLYKRDYQHPSPPWMNWDRDYYQVLTNNNGDSVAEPWETSLAFNTAEYYDGFYQVFVEAWDEYGNMAIDSQVVNFMNDNISVIGVEGDPGEFRLYPNPADDAVYISGTGKPLMSISVFNASMLKVKQEISPSSHYNLKDYKVILSGLPSGVYYLLVKSGEQAILKKVIKK